MLSGLKSRPAPPEEYLLHETFSPGLNQLLGAKTGPASWPVLPGTLASIPLPAISSW
jgi:hypothetical protein